MDMAPRSTHSSPALGPCKLQSADVLKKVSTTTKSLVDRVSLSLIKCSGSLNFSIRGRQEEGNSGTGRLGTPCAPGGRQDLALWPSSYPATSMVPDGSRHPPQQCSHCSRAAERAGAQVGGRGRSGTECSPDGARSAPPGHAACAAPPGRRSPGGAGQGGTGRGRLTGVGRRRERQRGAGGRGKRRNEEGKKKGGLGGEGRRRRKWREEEEKERWGKKKVKVKGEGRC